MPKQKTRRAAAKRFRITKKGKIVRRHAGMRHMLESRSKKKKRSLRGSVLVDKADVGRFKSMLPGV
ncbi:MAG: 50S ribosomal protein L35 [bacterium]